MMFRLLALRREIYYCLNTFELLALPFPLALRVYLIFSESRGKRILSYHVMVGLGYIRAYRQPISAAVLSQQTF